MLSWVAKLVGGTAPGPEAALYAAAVARARQPQFYAALQVPDTLDGRFEMVALHVFLQLRHLKSDPVLGQALFDTLFADMDRALREIGVSDVVIGNRIKEMARGFYGRISAYEAGLADPATLPAALRRNVYGTLPEADAAAIAALADYVCRCDAAMAADPARSWDAVALETNA